MNISALATTVLYALTPSLHGATASYDSQPHSDPVAIVELFTSEGCSSCPPADELLREINQRRAPSGQLVVAISEHVTYWNSLGWKDPYSSTVFTERQEAYASRFSLSGPYTPQMVLNGRSQFVGSDRAALRKALSDDAQRLHLGLQINNVTRSTNDAEVIFTLEGTAPTSIHAFALVTDDADDSHVLRGENSGRHLQHVAVARSLTKLAVTTDGQRQTARIPLPATPNSAGRHLALFLQEAHQGAILAATSVAL